MRKLPWRYISYDKTLKFLSGLQRCISFNTFTASMLLILLLYQKHRSARTNVRRTHNMDDWLSICGIQFCIYLQNDYINTWWRLSVQRQFVSHTSMSFIELVLTLMAHHNPYPILIASPFTLSESTIFIVCWLINVDNKWAYRKDRDFCKVFANYLACGNITKSALMRTLLR